MHVVLVTTAAPKPGHGGVLDVPEMHSMRRLHEYVSGVPPQRRAQLWSHLFRPIGLIIDPTFNRHKYSALPSHPR